MAARTSRHLPAPISPQVLLRAAAEGFFSPPPQGHFWLEHLVRTLAADPVPSLWRLYAVTSPVPAAPVAGKEQERAVAVYALDLRSRYAMFHAVDAGAGADLLAWALEAAPAKKVLGTYTALTRSLELGGLERRITRDHRELYLRLPLGGLAVEPDWKYRLATAADIPRLEEYNRLYNEERRTDWSRNWRETIAARTIYLREADGVVASCLMRGALLYPLVSFGGTFTFPEFRGRGEATMLVANFCAEMALSGLDVCLLVDDDNTAALRTYEKVGFLPEGLFRTVYF